MYIAAGRPPQLGEAGRYRGRPAQAAVGARPAALDARAHGRASWPGRGAPE